MGRARLDPPPRLPRRDRRAVGERAVAARPFGEEPQGAEGRPRRPPDRRPDRRHPAGHVRAGHDVDADPAADGQHDERARAALGPGAPLHGPGPQRARPRLAVAPVLAARQPPRGRHVGRGGPDAPVPDQGAGGDAADLPAVLRPLHAHGPGRQLDAHGGQVQVRDQARGPVRADARLPPGHAVGARRRGLGRRRREPADQAPGGVRPGAARHREHPRHPPGHQGAHGPAAALPAARRHGRAWSASGPRPASAASRSPCTRT